MIAIVTTNTGKFEEISQVLKGYEIQTEHRVFESAEKGATLEDIAMDKAREAWEHFSCPLVVEDTGIYFSAYENFPGTHAKRVFLDIGFDGLLRKLEVKSREAMFKTVLVFINRDGSHLFEGVTKGTIIEHLSSHEERDGMPYDRIFVPDGSETTWSDLSIEEKNVLSHRAKAARKLGMFLKER